MNPRDREKAEERLKAIEKEVEELRKTLNNSDSSSLQFHPNKGAKYYFINSLREVSCNSFDKDATDLRLFSLGNMYETAAIAKDIEEQQSFMIRFLTAGDLPRETQGHTGYTIRVDISSNDLSIRVAKGSSLLTAAARYACPDNQFSSPEKAWDWISNEGGREVVYKKLLRGWPK